MRDSLSAVLVHDSQHDCMAVASLFRDTPQWWSCSVKVQPPMIHPWFFGSKSQQTRPWRSYSSIALISYPSLFEQVLATLPSASLMDCRMTSCCEGPQKNHLVLGCLVHSDVVLKKTSTKSCCCFAGFHKNHRMLFNYSSWVAMGRCHRSTSTILIDTTTDEHSDSASCFKGIFTDLQDSNLGSLTSRVWIDW